MSITYGKCETTLMLPRVIVGMTLYYPHKSETVYEGLILLSLPPYLLRIRRQRGCESIMYAISN